MTVKQPWYNSIFYIGNWLEKLRKPRKSSFRTDGVPDGIPTRHLPNTSQKRYPLLDLSMKRPGPPDRKSMVRTSSSHFYTLNIIDSEREEEEMQTAFIKWNGSAATSWSNAQFVAWFTTLIFTVTTGPEEKVKHTTLVSRKIIQLQGINFLSALYIIMGLSLFSCPQ
jgi:hypothetical protein